MNYIRLLENQDFESMVDIVTTAYPGIMNPANKEKVVESFQKQQLTNDSIDFMGYFREENLLGTMRLHRYKMNLFSKLIDVGGVGLVAVDLLHKKERIAKELIEFFLKDFLEKDVNMVLLYPFRPDFYKKMGFGFGPKMNQYRILPTSFPKGSKSNLKYLSAEQKQLVQDCYQRFALCRHGMFLKTESELNSMFANPENFMIGYVKDGLVRGYMMFSFKKMSENNFVFNDLVVKELIYESPSVLKEICAFLHTQADQINRVVWNTQDESVHYLIDDPRNGTNHLIPSVYHETNVSGVGLMYRIINVKGFFKELEGHNFNQTTCRVKMNVEDTFLPKNNQSIILHVDQGAVQVLDKGNYDVEMTIDVADLSSLVMGSVTFKELYSYGKISLREEDFINTLHKMFLVDEKPICMTGF